MKRLIPLLLIFHLVGCLSIEKPEDRTVFDNPIAEGGPTLVYEKGNHDAFPISVSHIKSYLGNEEQIFIFDESLKWLAMETDVPRKSLHGMTAHGLVEYANALKEWGSKGDLKSILEDITDPFPSPALSSEQEDDYDGTMSR